MYLTYYIKISIDIFLKDYYFVQDFILKYYIKKIILKVVEAWL